ncbi:hypothetical protein W97_04109 [Coniosporium apollinis CBS 100218]|uniref:PRISE-like Rossmann-fold domain-containing protein n=1 Tax=Coniosporium apollinis (strain CBS 100218) TaxID=1168221 RepID=R7YSJ0_CONA1|nr:uncharacterized protein W97_04109 [Coniosporium apollinis CBS 100218]EON64875.1 hypothetical protein W97_04109 [Coniosporium apollinis CBS 100218]
MSIQQVQSRGIYHGLPVFPDDIEGLTAIITGANGISGQHMLRVLAQSPERWSKIYCLSRRPPAIPGGLPSNAKHIPLDFLKEPQEIADVLKKEDVKADYVFFYSYIQVEPKEGQGLWSNAEEMCEVNTKLLRNFLEALPLASVKPRRIMLQTGAKHYGLHLGPTSVPQEETDPRVLIEPNFYYPQEDLLFDYCKQHGIGWNVARPSFILGAVPDAAMNVCYPLAVYASVCKHMGQPLDFPYDLHSWETPQDQSSAMMNGYLEEWAVLTDAAENEAFNACDVSAFTWGKFWQKMAGWYGIEYKRPDPDAEYREFTVPRKETPRGFGPQSTVRSTFSFVEWANRPEVQKAWTELAEEHDLVEKKFRDIERIFSFTDAAVSNGIMMNFSMDKAHRLGFHGSVSSSQCILEVFNDFAKLKMIPPVPMVDVRFV